MQHRGLTAYGERLAKLAALAAGYGALGLSLLIAFEVVSRKIFSFSIQGVDEIGGYVMAAGVAFSFAYALVERAHTRVDVFLSLFPRRLRAPLNTIAQLALAIMAAFMFWRAVATLLESLEFQSRASTPLQTPLWIPQTVWVAGLGVFALFAIVLALRAVVKLASGQVDAVNREFGPRTTDDELDEAREEISHHDYEVPHGAGRSEA
ncbi:TRAP transporter small permease subunit [Arhodomonas sp. AD133]|uniref:TRAP transporter small permease subunit n=1 Tax=Arhodomonas sp. AD133 TaxID=3415009 RepID=UPI003EBABA18